MSWKPINPSHAIERVRVILKFGEQIPSKLARQMGDRVADSKRETRLEGPLPVNGFGFSVEVGADGMPIATAPSRKAQGWQFSRSADNSPIESIACVGEQLIYETLEYRRWEVFARRFAKIAEGASALATQSLDVAAVVLEYYDRFYFSGKREEARPSDLLTGLEGNLREDALSGRTFWHLHKGWFERAGNGDVLVNQNFDGQDVLTPENRALQRSVTMLTSVELRTGFYPIEPEPLMTHLGFMHALSKQRFEGALQPSMLPLVGIVKGEP